MRLFLSSENLGKYPEVFLDMLGSNKNVGLIENAKDDWSDEERTAKVKQHMEQFASQGFKPVDIDLRDYFGKEDELRQRIEDLGGVFVHGGNTFILRRAMAASGLDKILQDLVPAGRLAYGGSSAGSCIAAKSLKEVDIGDFPDVVPDGYPNKEIIWDGLGFVNFMVVPHVGTEWFGKEAEQVIENLEKQGTSHYDLSDGQVVVVNSDKVEVLK